MDTSDGDDVVEVLNDVLESARDGEYGFQSCADHADSAELQEHLPAPLAACAAAASKSWSAKFAALGEPASGGTIAGRCTGLGVGEGCAVIARRQGRSGGVRAW